MPYAPLARLAVIAAAAAAAGCATVSSDGPLAVEDLCEFSREGGPEGLSDITRIGGDLYYCVDDRGGMLHEVEIRLSDDGSDGSFAVRRSVKLEGRVDLEGCAYDPLTRWVWVSDEHDSSIRAYDPQTGRMVAKAAVPDVYVKHARSNRSLEALAITPDGLRMYAANEDTLDCDGAPAGEEDGGIVRIQEFTRTDSADIWRPSRQFRYATDPVEGTPYKGMALSGVSALCALGEGRLLVLEREMSRKKGLLPTLRGRLYEVDVSSASKTATKRLLWDESTMFSNYEGICQGPTTADGVRTLVLVSDGGGDVDENVLVLSLK
ncbi:MAG: esterase-like activity of phytase family protein [Kiritimatiellae bacterium]|nr:esterase-like activity of phytase family protein [Kiritimatiellia bacterium]